MAVERAQSQTPCSHEPKNNSHRHLENLSPWTCLMAIVSAALSHMGSSGSEMFPRQLGGYGCHERQLGPDLVQCSWVKCLSKYGFISSCIPIKQGFHILLTTLLHLCQNDEVIIKGNEFHF